MTTELPGNQGLLHEVLLEMSGPEGRPLFRSKVDLAAEMVRFGGYRDSKSAASAVSHVFHGHRRPNRRFAHAITSAVTARLGNVPPDVSEMWRQRVAHALGHTTSAFRESRQEADMVSPYDPGRLFPDLLDLVATADDQAHILSRLPCGRNRYDAAFRAALARRAWERHNRGSALGHCALYVPSSQGAAAWTLLAREVAECARPSEPDAPEAATDACLAALDGLGSLSVVETGRTLWVPSMHVFHPREAWACAFSYAVHSDPGASMIRWNADDIAGWKAGMYARVSPESGGTEHRVRWEPAYMAGEI